LNCHQAKLRYNRGARRSCSAIQLGYIQCGTT
jgi:hypothetical protein